MKTIKTLCIALLALTFSCSSDDDNGTPQTQMGAFPKKITKTDDFNPAENRSFNFTYNNENQITNISIVFPEGEVYRSYNFSYNNGMLTHLDSESIGYNFSYGTENILNSITLLFSGDEITVPVNYNAVSHSYSFTLEGTTTITLNADETFPLTYENDNPSLTAIGYTTTDGIFKNLDPQIGLFLTFGGLTGLDYLFFHPHQVQGVLQNGSEWTIENTRNDNDLITSVVANGPLQTYHYTIEYEQREL